MGNIDRGHEKAWGEYVDENSRIAHAVSVEDLESLRSLIRNTSDQGMTLWLAGNGGSSSAAAHAVADFVKTAPSMGKRGSRAFALHESSALLTALSNDVSFEAAFAETLQYLAKPGDLLLSISVSGLSPNLIMAHTSAAEIGLSTATIAGLRGRELADTCDAAVLIPSDDYQIVENLHVSILHWLAVTL